MNQESGPQVGANEAHDTHEGITELAHTLQAAIAACSHDGDVMDVFTAHLSQPSAADLEQALMLDIGVLTLDVAQYYQKVLRGLRASPSAGTLSGEAVPMATEAAPDRAVYEAIASALESVTEEEITVVAQLTSISELDATLRHPVRSQFRDIVDPLVQSARALIYESTLRFDLEHRTTFPEMWLVLDKLDRMLRAVGHIEQGVIHHTRTLYRDLPTRSQSLS
jgi:hypothetical protein